MELFETLMDAGIGRFKDYQCDYELLTLPKGSYIFTFWDADPIGITATGKPGENARNIERTFEALAGYRHGDIISFFYTKHTDPERAKTWLLNKARRDKATYIELLEIFACYYEKYYLQQADAGEEIPAGVVIDGLLKMKLEKVDLYSLPDEVASALYFIQLAKTN